MIENNWVTVIELTTSGNKFWVCQVNLKTGDWRYRGTTNSRWFKSGLDNDYIVDMLRDYAEVYPYKLQWPSTFNV